jgi:GH15 family glucan-1,4-alpha-glucosidase
VTDGADIAVDGTLDASLWGLFAFGLYEADDPRVAATMRALRDGLWVRGVVGGMARYDGDVYHRADDGVPGNPWVICTLWLADWLARIADSEAKLAEAVALLEWVARHALPSGVLPEQIDPGTGKPLSVAPLAWSHATYIATVQRVARRRSALRACPGCGLRELAAAGSDDWLGRLYAQMCKDIHDACKTA